MNGLVHRLQLWINLKFKTPKVCSATGKLRNDGTVRKDYLLIGTEIASADRTTNEEGISGYNR